MAAVMLKKLLLLWVGLLLAGAAQAAPTILVLGDSLSAGYGLSAEQGWVSLLRQRLANQGYAHQVVNASISGDTTAGGLARLPAALRTHQPALVLIELGANDGLRGLPVAQMQANLSKLSSMVRASGAEPVLFEMLIPSNYGPAYTQAFTRAFGATARTERAALVPFFLSAIAADVRNFQDDGIHPTAAAQSKMLDAVWPTLKPLLATKKPLASARTAAAR